MRLAKRVQTQLKTATDPAEIEALNADLHITEVDINYAKYFPFLEPYISMYKVSTNKEKDKEDEKRAAQLALHSERPPLWSTVEKAMEEGQGALERLRDRRSNPDADAPQPPSRPASKSKAKTTKKAKQERPAEPAKTLEDSRPKKVDGASKWVNPYKKKARESRDSGKREEASDSDDGGFFVEE